MRIARVDHWFKNVFMIPGVAVALFNEPELWGVDLAWRLAVAALAVGLVTSSNYVLNEILDAANDALHPVKRSRPIPAGQVVLSVAWMEWIGLGVAGLAVSWILGPEFFVCALVLAIMGCVYNVPPVRSKDKPYLDVLSESVNNPLRLLLGWYCTGTGAIPSLSLAMAYWMLGAFFMAVKRFAELRRIGDPDVAGRYRASFLHYTQERLLISIVYYGVAFGLFFGIFIVRYHMELLISVPFLAGFIAMYIHVGYMDDSPVQYPERLYQHRGLMVYATVCAALMIGLMFVDFDFIERWFAPTMQYR